MTIRVWFYDGSFVEFSEHDLIQLIQDDLTYQLVEL